MRPPVGGCTPASSPTTHTHPTTSNNTTNTATNTTTNTNTTTTTSNQNTNKNTTTNINTTVTMPPPRSRFGGTLCSWDACGACGRTHDMHHGVGVREEFRSEIKGVLVGERVRSHTHTSCMSRIVRVQECGTNVVGVGTQGVLVEARKRIMS